MTVQNIRGGIKVSSFLASHENELLTKSPTEIMLSEEDKYHISGRI